MKEGRRRFRLQVVAVYVATGALSLLVIRPALHSDPGYSPGPAEAGPRFDPTLRYEAPRAPAPTRDELPRAEPPPGGASPAPAGPASGREALLARREALARRIGVEERHQEELAEKLAAAEEAAQGEIPKPDPGRVFEEYAYEVARYDLLEFEVDERMLERARELRMEFPAAAEVEDFVRLIEGGKADEVRALLMDPESRSRWMKHYYRMAGEVMSRPGEYLPLFEGELRRGSTRSEQAAGFLLLLQGSPGAPDEARAGAKGAILAALEDAQVPLGGRVYLAFGWAGSSLEDPEVREASRRTVVEVASGEAASDREDLRTVAIYRLASLPGPATEDLLRRLVEEEPSADLRIAAIDAWVGLEGEASRALLERRRAVESDPEVLERIRLYLEGAK